MSFHLYQKTASGAGNEEEVLAPQGAIFAQDRSSDGRYLVYATFDPKTLGDLWILPLGAPPADRKPIP